MSWQNRKESTLTQHNSHPHTQFSFHLLSSPKQPKQKMVPSKFLILILTITLLPILSHSADYTNLIFKGCADQNFQDFNTNYRQQLTTLINTLTTQSTTTKFYTTTTNSLTGLFQCRNDLSNQDCNRCVRKIPPMAQRLCGQAIAARIQLTGCYLSYAVSNFKQPSGTDLLFKICGVSQASGAGFGDRLDSALGEVVKGVSSGNGFYAGGYQSVYVLGQCEGDLSGNECGNCVKSAVDRSKSECGNSISAQIYLQQCYVSYTYYPNGVPGNGNGGQGGTQETVSSSSHGPGRSTQKLVAIVLGGIVGVGLVMSCLLFTKSVFKKKTRAHKFGG